MADRTTRTRTPKQTVTMISRRSARANKGMHSKRDLSEYLVDFSDTDESDPKRPRTEAPLDDEYTDGDVRCTPCKTDKYNYNEDTDTGGTFIQCDKCTTWQHAKCMGFKEDVDIPEQYFCNICTIIPQAAQHDTLSQYVLPPKSVSKVAAFPVAPTPKAPSVVSLLSMKDENRTSTAKAFYNYFKRSLPADLLDEEKDHKATAWAIEIEHLIFEMYQNKRYIEGGRRILFLLKKHFMAEILQGSLTFKELINKSPKEINQDIEAVEAKVKGNIKNIILTANEPSDIIRRTHKGEEIRENENEGIEELYLNISMRSVDHRRFDDENHDQLKPLELPLLEQRLQQQQVYQNMNPRFDDDDDQGPEKTPEEPASQPSLENEGVDSDNSNSNETQEVFGASPTVANENSDSTHVTEQAAESLPEPISDLDLRSILGETPVELLARKPAEVTLQPTPGSVVWRGSITFPDYATFDTLALFYSSSTQVLRLVQLKIGLEIYSRPSYYIEGRLDRLRADAYLNKIFQSRSLYLVQLKPDSATQAGFDKLYAYLRTENKVGVLSGKPWFVKDSYVLAVDFGADALPPYLQLQARDVSHGLYVLHTVKKDYVPSNGSSMGLAPAAQPSLATPTDLNSIMNQLNAGVF